MVKKKNNKKKQKAVAGDSLLNEVLAVFALLVGLFLFLSILSFKFYTTSSGYDTAIDDLARTNLLGPLGHLSATILTGLLGWSALSIPMIAIYASVHHFRTELKDLDWYLQPWNLISSVLLIALLAGLAFSYSGHAAGGDVGRLVVVPLSKYFNITGALLILATTVLVLVAHLSRSSLLSFFKFATSFGVNSFIFLAVTLPLLAWNYLSQFFSYIADHFHRDYEEEELPVAPVKTRKKRVKPSKSQAEPEEEKTEVIVRRNLQASSRYKKKKNRKSHSDYQMPDVDILKAGEHQTSSEDDKVLLDKSKIIEEKLRDFNIKGKITEVHPGPVITMFEFEPAAGVKVGKIAALQDDLAMSLRATAIRIIAPIPNKGTVGIEVPNENRDLVRLRDVIESPAFFDSNASLNIALGKDIYGQPVVVDVAKMPHLLMAGATGAGKSVCINTILLSMLYRCSPEELGLILIDPKILELSVYEGIPHLKAPVVTVPKQAKAVLEWSVKEMDHRCLLYTSPSPRDKRQSRMPSSA